MNGSNGGGDGELVARGNGGNGGNRNFGAPGGRASEPRFGGPNPDGTYPGAPTGGYGNDSVDQRQPAKGPSTSKLAVIALAAIAVVAVIGVAVWWFLGGAEDRDKSAMAEGATAATQGLANSDSFTEWNALVCEKYRGDPDSVKMADEILGSLSDASGFSRIAEDMPESFDADDVTFLNEERTMARVSGNGEQVDFAKEGDKWLFCDPDFDFTQFNAIPSLNY